MSDRTFEKRLDDCIRRVTGRWVEEVTDFMPRQLARQVESMLIASGVNWAYWGGYDDAERVRIALSMNDGFEDNDFRLSILEIRGKMIFVQPTHRDYLGALMSLGFDRDKMGDIIVRRNGCDVFITNELVSYVCSAGLTIKRVPVTVSMASLKQWQPPERQFKEKTVFVKSLRLDAVMAQGFGLSRSEALKRIRGGQVSVSYAEVLVPSYQLVENDLISVRGLGKLRVGHSMGKSKKERIALILHRYL